MKRSNGYVLVRCPNHPYSTKAGYVREHRLVMEKVLGRYLDPHEVVHHINGVKNDNRPENLQLFQSNGRHCSETLQGIKKNWTEDGLQRLAEAVHQRRAGIPLPKEHRESIAKALQGHEVSEETKKKIGHANRGKPKKQHGARKLSPEVRQKLADMARMRFAGKQLSAEHKAKISQALKEQPCP